MAYARTNFKTKKALKEAVASGTGDLTIYQPGGLVDTPTHGEVVLEGPHYPQPHRWYARVKVEDGKIVKVLS